MSKSRATTHSDVADLLVVSPDGSVKKATPAIAGSHAECRVEWNGSTSAIRGGHGFTGGTQFGDGSTIVLDLEEPLAPEERVVWLKCFAPLNVAIHGLVTEIHDHTASAEDRAAVVKFALVRNNTDPLFNYENYVYVKVERLATAADIPLAAG